MKQQNIEIRAELIKLAWAGTWIAALLLLSASITLASPPAGALEALWLFEGTGLDQTHRHHCQIYGGASFVETPGGLGLHTVTHLDRAHYAPPVSEMPTGNILVTFRLDEPFRTDPDYFNPIILINSNRTGHLVGDFSLRLDPLDGKLWFVQEEAVPHWTLKTNKSHWEANTWFQVSVSWGEAGRSIYITRNQDSPVDYVDDTVVSPCFSADAELSEIASRDIAGSPLHGLTVDYLQISNAEAPSSALAIWGFENSGLDQTDRHHAQLAGGAAFVTTPGGTGLYTTTGDDLASCEPVLPQLDAGRMHLSFKLEAPFTSDPDYTNPIGIFGSNRMGLYIGDCGIRLDPEDGKLWFVQEGAIPHWTLKTNKDYWEANTWFEITVAWSETGRSIAVSWPEGSDFVADDVVSPCFSEDADWNQIAYRDSTTAPNHGLTLEYLSIIDGSEQIITGVDEDQNGLCGIFSRCVPNPFNPQTEIRFSMREPSLVHLRVFDLQGRLVNTLRAGERFEAGNHSLVWSGRNDLGRPQPSGVYLYELRIGSRWESGKMTLLK